MIVTKSADVRRSVKFLLLLHGDAEAEAALSADDRRAILDQHFAFATFLRESGALVASEALGPPEQARTVRFDGSELLVTDGPFLESKEALGGFYVIEAASAEAATSMLERVPRSPGLFAELLPIVTM